MLGYLAGTGDDRPGRFPHDGDPPLVVPGGLAFERFSGNQRPHLCPLWRQRTGGLVLQPRRKLLRLATQCSSHGADGTSTTTGHRCGVTRRAAASRVAYASRRFGRDAAYARIKVQIGAPAAATCAQPGTLEHFLVERYVFYNQAPGGRLQQGRVRHSPYPLSLAPARSRADARRVAAGRQRIRRIGPAVPRGILSRSRRRDCVAAGHWRLTPCPRTGFQNWLGDAGDSPILVLRISRKIGTVPAGFETSSNTAFDRRFGSPSRSAASCVRDRNGRATFRRAFAATLAATDRRRQSRAPKARPCRW